MANVRREVIKCDLKLIFFVLSLLHAFVFPSLFVKREFVNIRVLILQLKQSQIREMFIQNENQQSENKPQSVLFIMCKLGLTLLPYKFSNWASIQKNFTWFVCKISNYYFHLYQNEDTISKMLNINLFVSFKMIVFQKKKISIVNIVYPLSNKPYSF